MQFTHRLQLGTDSIITNQNQNHVISHYDYVAIHCQVTKDMARGGGLGITIKKLRGWGLVVHALPLPSPPALGPAESVGVQCGDILVGLDGRLLRPSATADDVAAV
jgi:hypothetical protein